MAKPELSVVRTMSRLCVGLLLLGALACAPPEPTRNSVRFPLGQDPADLSFSGARDAYSLALGTELDSPSVLTP